MPLPAHFTTPPLRACVVPNVGAPSDSPAGVVLQEVLFSVPRKNPTEKARALLFRLKKQMNRLM
eukprot:1745929-Rhodomonas_salina.2